MDFVTLIGYATIAYILYFIAKFVYTHFIMDTNLAKYGSKKGSWALVTGAREGIGRGYATALAKKGFNVVLIARNQAGLEEVSKELVEKYKVQTKVLAIDCSGESAVKDIVTGIQGLPVSVLVNNVGVNTELPSALAETSDKDINNMLDVNIRFTTHLTKAMIPILSQQKSLILNLSSFTGKVPVGLMSVYSATKAYVNAFSRALSSELQPAGIDVASVTPHYVVSAMSGFRRRTWAVPTGEEFGLATLRQVGSGNYTISPHWFHDLFEIISTMLPDTFVGAQGLKNMTIVRKKLQARANKQKTN